MDSERDMRDEFREALDEVLPPAPWLEAVVTEELRRRRPPRLLDRGASKLSQKAAGLPRMTLRWPAAVIGLRLPRHSQQVAGVLLIAILAVTAAEVFLLTHRTFLVPVGSKGTIDIGADVSNTGDFDLAVRDGVAFAVEQAGAVRGFTLRFVPYDDSVQGAYSSDQGAQNMQQMVLDHSMAWHGWPPPHAVGDRDLG